MINIATRKTQMYWNFYETCWTLTIAALVRVPKDLSKACDIDKSVYVTNLTALTANLITASQFAGNLIFWSIFKTRDSACPW